MLGVAENFSQIFCFILSYSQGLQPYGLQLYTIVDLYHHIFLVDSKKDK